MKLDALLSDQLRCPFDLLPCSVPFFFFVESSTFSFPVIGSDKASKFGRGVAGRESPFLLSDEDIRRGGQISFRQLCLCGFAA